MNHTVDLQEANEVAETAMTWSFLPPCHVAFVVRNPDTALI